MSVWRASDGMAYTLQIYPLEDPGGEGNYSLKWAKQQSRPRLVAYLQNIVE